MGYYIETPSRYDKAYQLQALHGATIHTGSFEDVPAGRTLVCVVQNGLFDAAGIVYDEDEYQAFNYYPDPRPKTWLTLPTEKVLELNPSVAHMLPETATV